MKKILFIFFSTLQVTLATEFPLDKDLQKIVGTYEGTNKCAGTTLKITFTPRPSRVLEIEQTFDEGSRVDILQNINGETLRIPLSSGKFLQRESRFLDGHLWIRQRECRGLPFFRRCGKWRTTQQWMFEGDRVIVSSGDNHRSCEFLFL